LKADEAAQQILDRAWSFCVATQTGEGSWLALPSPRVLETALVATLAQQCAFLGAEVGAARHWLERWGRAQTHHPIAETIDRWLLAQQHAPGALLDVSSPTFQQAAFLQRRLVFSVLATALGCPVQGGPDMNVVASKLRQSVVGKTRTKVWTAAETSALLLLLPHDDEARLAALNTIASAQHRDGSIGANPISTVVVLFALSRCQALPEVAQRAEHHLRTTQQADGSWRFASAEIWDTALLLRAFASKGGDPAFARAVQYMVSNQNNDGGFPYRPGVESDTDTTGMALMGIRYAPEMTSAVDYLRHKRVGDVWQTWNADGDPPAADAVAHAILGLRAHNCSSDELVGPERWLEQQLREHVGWEADWYNIHSYACHEVALVLGRRSRAVRYAFTELLKRQADDGGWGPHPGATSTPAATSLALGLASQYLPNDDERMVRGIRFLGEHQQADGFIGGPTDMFAPRPFAVDYPYQSLALSVIGPSAMLAKRSRVHTDRRRIVRSQRTYHAVAWQDANKHGPSLEGDVYSGQAE
jgi:squalene-hopene/tetraprenyl-beta-curcumene cyclase